jgi:hypothetical protein
MVASKKSSDSNYQPKKGAQQENRLAKQMLNDLEQRISLNVGNFLVLSEEGDPAQIALAHQKAKSEFLKFGPEMHKIAAHMGGTLVQFVDEFLESVDSVLHTTSGFLDDDLVSKCFHTTRKLESELKL